MGNSALSSPEIGHSDIAAFANESVNLKREDAADYREQVRRLREKLDKYASDHPDYGLIKTLLSGSLAKGTALKTLNDIDLAFYVDAATTPKGEPDLLEWLAARIREAYPQMKPDQIKVNRHSVCIKYAVSGLSVDVVPVQYKGDPATSGGLHGAVQESRRAATTTQRVPEQFTSPLYRLTAALPAPNRAIRIHEGRQGDG